MGTQRGTLRVVKAEKHTCANCAFGRFQMTKHKPPRIKLHTSGRCDVPLPEVKWPLSVTKQYGFLNFEKGWVLPHWEDCPLWTGRDAEAVYE